MIRKFKRRKAAGPDEVPMEMFMEMDDTNFVGITDVSNDWWGKEWVPGGLNEARVVLNFKKGYTKNLKNYRPTSVLNSIYKIFTAILRQELRTSWMPIYKKHSTDLGKVAAQRTQSILLEV